MRFNAPPEPVTATPEDIARALADVDVPPLLVAVAHVTGDTSVLAEAVRPDPTRVLEPSAGLDDAQLERGRELAVEALVRFAAAGSERPATTSPDRLRELMHFLVGDAVDDGYQEVLEEELSLDGVDHRAPTWRLDDVTPGRTMRVLVVGAGMSGIVMALRLSQIGADVTVVDKNPDVGGTWLENTYPGCRVDVPSHLYSYSFAQTGDWPGFFSAQPDLLGYFRECVEHLGLRPLMRFDTEVLAATFDDEAQTWSVRVRIGGREEVVEADAVVSAVGQLNRPKFPDLAGMDSFRGLSFHSARWPADLDLRGQRVGIIGTGASAAQFIPPVAEAAGHLTVFQRTPPWLIPTPNYHDDLPDGVRWVLRHIPEFARWDRLWMFWRTHEGLLPMCEVDPSWPDQSRSVSASNDLVRELLGAYIEAEFTDPETLAKVLPTYPPVAKRVVRDNGILARTYARTDVALVTDGIAEVTPTGIRTVDGTHHDLDVIVYGTGFTASDFLVPMTVTGRGGVDLHERWGGDARAYLGLTIPEFPNLFVMYGPNTNIVINGSIIYFSECEAHYVTESLRLLAEQGKRSLEVRAEVHDRFNEAVDEANQSMAWGAATVNSWYRNAQGRVSQNWPFSLLAYWQRTRRVDPDEYHLR